MDSISNSLKELALTGELIQMDHKQEDLQKTERLSINLIDIIGKTKQNFSFINGLVPIKWPLQDEIYVLSKLKDIPF